MVQLGAFSVSIANKKYSSLSGDYEIFLLGKSRVELSPDQSLVATRPSFRFRAVKEFESLPVDGLYGMYTGSLHL